MRIKYWENHPKWRANATTAFLSFHKSEIGTSFPFKSNTFTESSELAVSSPNTGDSTPVHIHPLMQSSLNYIWIWSFNYHNHNDYWKNINLFNISTIIIDKWLHETFIYLFSFSLQREKTKRVRQSLPAEPEAKGMVTWYLLDESFRFLGYLRLWCSFSEMVGDKCRRHWFVALLRWRELDKSVVEREVAMERGLRKQNKKRIWWRLFPSF